MEDSQDLHADIERLLLGLRACTDQPSAVAWMRQAYLTMERCQAALAGRPTRAEHNRTLRQLDDLREQADRPAQVVKERLVFLPLRRSIEIVGEMPSTSILARQRPVWMTGETVVYPEAPMPLPLRQPRAWTHRDTLRLERAAAARRAAEGKRK